MMHAGRGDQVPAAGDNVGVGRAPDDPVAVAVDAPLDDPCELPVLDLNRPDAIAAFIVGYVAGEQPAAKTASGGPEPTR